MFNNANGRCEFLCAPPSSSALAHTQDSTALHHPAPPTEHVPGLAQAGEWETACGPVHGAWRKVRPMTRSTAAALALIVQ
jgi:hypothetical protein